jgi:hypothetical protein
MVKVTYNQMHAALDVNIPNYARAMVTTHHVVDALAAVQPRGSSAPSLSVRGVKGCVCPLHVLHLYRRIAQDRGHVRWHMTALR